MRIQWNILYVFVFIFTITGSQMVANASPDESLVTSIYLESYGDTVDKIQVINKNHELWTYTYGSTEKQLIMTDVSQIDGKFYNACDILKTDGSLWKFLPSPTSTPGSWDASNPSDYNRYQKVNENLNKIPLDKWITDQLDNLNIKNVKKIYYGAEATFFIKSDNSLWGIGDNSKGQMGRGLIYDDMRAWQIGPNESTVTVPSLNVKNPVKILDNVKDVFVSRCATRYTQEGIFALKYDGSVWTWGDSTPVQVDISSNPWKFTKELDSGKEYPRLAPAEFQNIKCLVVGPAMYKNEGESIYNYLKINNDNSVYIKGNFNNKNLSEFTQYPVNNVLGSD